MTFALVIMFDYSWVVGIWLVKKLTSKDLLERLQKKGTRNPEFTKGLIIEKLNDDDEVSTTSLKVTVSCPLGKMRMTVSRLEFTFSSISKTLTANFIY